MRRRSSLLHYRAPSRKLVVMNRHERSAKKPAVVKIGNTRLRIYKGKSGGYDLFTIDYRANGKRKRETRASFEKAKARAQEIAMLIENGRLDVLQLSSTDRESYVQAMRRLRPLQIPLHAAIEEYAAAREHLAGDALLPALKDYATRRRTITEKRVGEVVAELLAAKSRGGLSLRYRQTLRSHLNRFAESLQTNIGSVTAKLIEAWLDRLSVGPRARNNIRMSVVTLFHFARTNNYLPKGQATEADEVSKVKDRGGDIGILSPKQLADSLAAGDGETKLYLAIGAFTGLRSAELIRLDWQDFNLGRGHVQVGKAKAKTASRRLVPIQANLMQWVSPHKGKAGRVFASEHAASRSIAQAKEVIGDWPTNALRHSYASYRLAQCHDAARVALEMGTSAQMLFRNYRELADEHDAAAWFAIAPKRPKNVLPMVA
jgi:integrase